MTYIIREDDISILPLSVRSTNCMRRAGVHTIGAMIDFPEEEWIKVRNMGVKSVAEILDLVHALKAGAGKIVGMGEFAVVEVRDETAEPTRTSCAMHRPGNTDTVFVDENGAILEDVPVEKLGLPVRAENCLKNGGIFYASELIGKTLEDLLRLKNMGEKSAKLTLEKIEKIKLDCVSNSVYGENGKINSSTQIDEIAKELSLFYGHAEEIWLREILSIKAQYPEACGESLIYRLYDSTLVRSTTKTTILTHIENAGGELSSKTLAEKLPGHLSNTTIMEEMLLELEAGAAIAIGEILIRRVYPSVIQFVRQLSDERAKAIIQGRLEGNSLSEVGERYGITRERARQIMLKTFRRAPHFKEDEYRYIFEAYDFSEEDFGIAFSEPKEVYNYLEMISRTSRHERLPMEKILSDSAVPAELRKKAEKAIYKQYVTINGVRIKKVRTALAEHFVKMYCKELTRFEDFVEKYHAYLDELGLGGDEALLIESRTYENKFNMANYILWNQWSSFRYYNIAGRDYAELLSTLDLESLENTEFSTLKLFRDYPALMEQYDIRDEYELHNLLKKVWPKEKQSVIFKRMPTIVVGEASADEQVMALLLQFSPISGEDLARKYEDTYGVKATTVRGGALRNFDNYYYNGMYSIDCKEMPDVERQRMSIVLNGDFYTMKEVKRLYRREFPNSDIAMINPYTLKVLGFHVYPGYSGYIVKNTYSGAIDYFQKLLTMSDIIDVRECDKDMRNITTYDVEHRKLRKDYEIVEFLPLQLINIRRLSEAGVTKERLKKYCNTVAQFVEKGEYFTITSLRQDGFYDSLDELGFDEWFYSSVLIENRELFSYQRTGGTRLLLRGKPNAHLGDMLCWVLEKYQRIDFYELMELLENRYGILVPKEKIIEIISGTELYYDAIMEAVYINYDTYFEEI